MSGQGDLWHRWLLERRFGGDERLAERTLGNVMKLRDNVLQLAELGPDEVLLDVGCGDGLIGFGAIEREPTADVIFSDVSEDLLAHCRQLAESDGVAARCRFVRASARDLSDIHSASVDVVTTRSVLIYEDDKADAFGEFWRVLRPGGRISVGEPINRWFLDGDEPRLYFYDCTAVRDLALRVGAQFKKATPTAMMDFGERDLLDMAEAAGFGDLYLRLDLSVRRAPELPWDGFFHSSPNPLSPTMEEAVHAALTPDEAERFVAHLRTLVERREGTERLAFAYLRGRKP